MDNDQGIRVCTNCLHCRAEENNESQCGIGYEMHTGRCRAFTPKNAKVEKDFAREVVGNLHSTPFIYAGIALVACALLCCFIIGYVKMDNTDFVNPFTISLVAVGIFCLIIAGILHYVLRLRRKQMAQEVRHEVENMVRRELLPKLLTQEAIEEYLTKHNYLPEPTQGGKGTIFTFHEIHYVIYFDDVNRVVIRYTVTLEEDDVPTIEYILKARDCKVFATDMWVQEYTEDNGESSRALECIAEFFVEYVDNFERVFPLYLSNLESTASALFYNLNQCKGTTEDVLNKNIQRRDDIYNPEYRWFPLLLNKVSAGQIAMEALTDEEWLRATTQNACKDEVVRNEWNDFKIKRVDNYGDYKLIVYQFPEPKVAPEAKYGIILLNKQSLAANYFTLEMSLDDKWYYGGVVENRHLNYGETESADLDRFIEWVLGDSKKVILSTDYTKGQDKQ